MKENLFLASTDRISSLHISYWLPDKEKCPKVLGILQITHGMTENIARYEDFALFLSQQGFIVIGHDHLGHGYSLSATSPVLGYFAKKDAIKVLVEDCWLVTQWAQTYFPDLPYFLLGHSMGSFITRLYLNKYSSALTGVILTGTGKHRRELKIFLPFLDYLNTHHSIRPNPFIAKIMASQLNHAISDKKTDFDWLSRNDKTIRDFISDPMLGFTFTNNGFFHLLKLLLISTHPNWTNGIRKDLPFLISSGLKDAVGQMGKGPRKVCRELKQAKIENVTLILYQELRHEILNELEKHTVYQDILWWLKKQLKEHSP